MNSLPYAESSKNGYGELASKYNRLVDVLASFREKSEREVARVRDAWKQQCELRDNRIKVLETEVQELIAENKLLATKLSNKTLLTGETVEERVYEHSNNDEIKELRELVLKLTNQLQAASATKDSDAVELKESLQASQLRQFDKSLYKWAYSMISDCKIEISVSANGCLLKISPETTYIFDYLTIHFDYDAICGIFKNSIEVEVLRLMKNLPPFEIEHSPYLVEINETANAPVCSLRLFGDNNELDQLTKLVQADAINKPPLSTLIHHILNMNVATGDRLTFIH